MEGPCVLYADLLILKSSFLYKWGICVYITAFLVLTFFLSLFLHVVKPLSLIEPICLSFKNFYFHLFWVKLVRTTSICLEFITYLALHITFSHLIFQQTSEVGTEEKRSKQVSQSEHLANNRADFKHSLSSTQIANPFYKFPIYMEAFIFTYNFSRIMENKQKSSWLSLDPIIHWSFLFKYALCFMTTANSSYFSSGKSYPIMSTPLVNYYIKQTHGSNYIY